MAAHVIVAHALTRSSALLKPLFYYVVCVLLAAQVLYNGKLAKPLVVNRVAESIAEMPPFMTLSEQTSPAAAYEIREFGEVLHKGSSGVDASQLSLLLSFPLTPPPMSSPQPSSPPAPQPQHCDVYAGRQRCGGANWTKEAQQFAETISMPAFDGSTHSVFVSSGERPCLITPPQAHRVDIHLFRPTITILRSYMVTASLHTPAIAFLRAPSACKSISARTLAQMLTHCRQPSHRHPAHTHTRTHLLKRSATATSPPMIGVLLTQVRPRCALGG